MNKIWLILLFTGAAVLCFVAGVILGGNRAAGMSDAIHQQLSQVNMAAHYSTLVEISGHLATGQKSQAKCIADVTASAYYRDLRMCISDGVCRVGIEEDVKKIAPELLSGDQPRFRYYENMERCRHETK